MEQLKSNLILLKIIGISPLDDTHNFQFYFIVISVVTSCIFECAVFFAYYNDAGIILEAIPPFLTVFATLIKMVNIILQRKKIKNLIEMMKHDWQTKKSQEEMEIFETYKSISSKNVIVYTGGIYISCLLYGILPFTPKLLKYFTQLNISDHQELLYRAEYGIDTEKYYKQFIVYQYITVFINISIIIAADSLFITFTVHARYSFVAAGYRLENLFNYEKCSNSKSMNNYQFYLKKVTSAIDSHLGAIRYAESIEDTYTTVFAFILIIDVVIISSTLFQLSMSQEIYTKIKQASFITGQLFHLYCATYPAQKVIDCSQNVFNEIYSSLWYEMPPEIQKVVKMVLLRSSKPCLLTAGRFYILSMENFSALLQTSLSYFTMLQSVN